MDVSQARACPQATAKVLRGCGGGCGGEGGTQLMEHAVPGFSVAAAAATAVHPCARLLLKLPGLGRQQLLHPCMCCEDAHAVVWGQAIGAEGGVHKGGQHLGGSSHFCRLCCFCCCCRCCLLCVAAVVWVAFGVMELPKQAVQLSCGTAHIDLCGTKLTFLFFTIQALDRHFASQIIIPPYTGFLGHASASLARQEEMVNENILLDTQAATLKGALQCSLDTHTHWVPSNVQLHVKLLNSVPEFSANCVRQPHQLNVNQRHVHLIDIKYCEDTRPGQQLEAAQRQHADL
eukprot:1161297-Pelagomonas_calceolata.AAC.1